jgi:hypothetical protein
LSIVAERGTIVAMTALARFHDWSDDAEPRSDAER